MPVDRSPALRDLFSEFLEVSERLKYGETS
jgi:hypothetical protein